MVEPLFSEWGLCVWKGFVLVFGWTRILFGLSSGVMSEDCLFVWTESVSGGWECCVDYAVVSWVRIACFCRFSRCVLTEDSAGINPRFWVQRLCDVSCVGVKCKISLCKLSQSLMSKDSALSGLSRRLVTGDSIWTNSCLPEWGFVVWVTQCLLVL